MSTYPCMVEDCGRPAHDTTICSSCQSALERDLESAGLFRAELEVKLARQSVMGEREGGKSAERPLPYDPAAAEALAVLRSALFGWVRMLMTEKHPSELLGPTCRCCLHTSCSRVRASHWPADTIDAMAEKLLGEALWLRSHEAAHEAVDEIGAAVENARREVDRKPARWYAGPCQESTPDGECDGQLYARASAVSVTCGKCSTVFEVAQRREWLRDSVSGHLGTASEISALCRSLLGDLVTSSMIRGYAHRGAIAPHGDVKDPRGRMVPLYQIGEVMTAAARAGGDSQSRREARRAAREVEEMSEPAGTQDPTRYGAA